jgi:2-succinyl-5-enolpyruvyl-6-hydroxy-3-cyclohexene-1-carboxylate synthase
VLTALDRKQLELSAPARQTWAAQIGAAARRGHALVSEVLGELPFGEGHAVREVCRALPQRSVFVIGNSLPIRAVDAFAVAAPRGIRTLVQRGVNGIDGLVSGAAGSALAHDAATTLLLGDVSLAHDVGGLVLAREAKRALVVVVLDNGGGRIFDQLPWGQAASATAAERDFWLTPPRLDLLALAQGYGLAYDHADALEPLTLALERAYQRAGATLLHVKVAPGSYQAALTRARALTKEPLR